MHLPDRRAHAGREAGGEDAELTRVPCGHLVQRVSAGGGTDGSAEARLHARRLASLLALRPLARRDQEVLDQEGGSSEPSLLSGDPSSLKAG